MSPSFSRAAVGLLFSVASSLGASAIAAPAAPLLAAPQIFEPGTVSGGANDGSPTFSPDGNTLLFTRSGASGGIILQSDRSNGRWSEPRIAAFSGEWNDSQPEFSPDGRYAVFVSIRPAATGSPGAAPHRVANLWRANRVGDGWSAPVRLPDAVNIGPSIWKPSIAGNGSIYFLAIDASGSKRLYCSRYEAGVFHPAQPLPFSDGKIGDGDPEVAPDESFMIFASSGRLAGDSKDHLFVVFKKAGVWGTPIPIRYAGDDANGYSSDDEPHLSHDLRTLYFSSDRWVPVHYPRTPEEAQRDLQRIEGWDNSNTNAWFLSLAPLIDAARETP